MPRSMMVIHLTVVKTPIFDFYILSHAFISKSLCLWDLGRAGLQFGLSETEIFYFSMFILKAQQELLTLFCLQQIYLHLFLTTETLQLLPLSLYSQRLFKVEQWILCPGKLFIKGFINHLLLYRCEISISEIWFVLQSDVNGLLFSPFGEGENISAWDAKNNFIKTNAFHFLEHIKC